MPQRPVPRLRLEQRVRARVDVLRWRLHCVVVVLLVGAVLERQRLPWRLVRCVHQRHPMPVRLAVLRWRLLGRAVLFDERLRCGCRVRQRGLPYLHLECPVRRRAGLLQRDVQRRVVLYER